MIFKEVHKGIDSLYLSFRGDIKEEILEELITKRELAKSDDEALQAQATMILGNHCFEVKDKGKGKYKFVLVDAWFHIQIAGGSKNKIPDVYVQISSELLNCTGLDKSLNLLRSVVSMLLISVDDESISRVDPFVDFVTVKDFKALNDDLWVAVADSDTGYRENRKSTGCAFGKGGAITARLYNKTTEIMKTNKAFFKEIWKKEGWEESQEVWRIEFQLRKDFLNAMSTSSMPDLALTINDIWRYCTNDWLRLAVDDGTKNRSRWPTDELWKGIQGVMFGDGSFTGITRSVDKSRLPDDKQLFLNGIGILISYALKNGHKEIWKVADRFLTDAIKFLDDYLKHSADYQDSSDYIKKKMDVKRKRFNIKPE